MREILFRGKDIKGNWHIGLLAHIGNAWYISNKTGVSTAFEVIPETIGQYTGLTDNNDNKIFEGDIVKAYGRKGAVTANKFNCGCCYPVYGFAVCEYNEETPSDLIEINDCEVIGNIHDNPELLKD